MSNKAVSVYAEALKRQQKEEGSKPSPKTTPKVTRKTTRTRDKVRDTSRDKVRDKSRGTVRDNSRSKSRDLPSRDEIQEFSFRLRDELRVKVQAELPPQWQKELDKMARDLDVKKLELYRFIFGKFLGKVQRKKSA